MKYPTEQDEQDDAGLLQVAQLLMHYSHSDKLEVVPVEHNVHVPDELMK
jgi:hypothetical protein